VRALPGPASCRGAGTVGAAAPTWSAESASGSGLRPTRDRQRHRGDDRAGIDHEEAKPMSASSTDHSGGRCRTLDGTTHLPGHPVGPPRSAVTRSQQPLLGEHAVVLGASMGGLAARVLADFYETVTVVERDMLPENATNRRGVPQGRHVHLLLGRGSQILGELFPGFQPRRTRRGWNPRLRRRRFVQTVHEQWRTPLPALRSIQRRPALATEQTIVGVSRSPTGASRWERHRPGGP